MGTDEKHIRVQSAILYKTPALSLFLSLTAFFVRMRQHPCGKRGSRAIARNVNAPSPARAMQRNLRQSRSKPEIAPQRIN
ncbi:MAG TPA: hypothetical protein VIJ43_03975, partial [Burkholderiales bacterium]